MSTKTIPEIESADELANRFSDLNAVWRAATAHFSRMDKMAAHPAFREIVEMGEKAVPLILADLEKPNPGFLFMALREITSDGPIIPEEDRGRIRKIQAAWIAWGHAKGYRWESV